MKSIILLVYLFLFPIVIFNNILCILFSFIFIIITASFLLFILKIEFLVFVFLLVYLSAVSILFLFVIMMFQLNLFEVKNFLENNFHYSNLIYVFLIIKVYFYISVIIYKLNIFLDFFNLEYSQINKVLNFNQSGCDYIIILNLFSENFFIFILLSIILLFSMLGSICLCLNSYKMFR